MTITLPLLAFALTWVITFIPAWKLLARLVAVSAGRLYSMRNWQFWALFISYRLVIAAPYLVLLAFGDALPPNFVKLVWGWVIFCFALSGVRFIGPVKAAQFLWWLYGFVYDGLRVFYPYQLLIQRMVARAEISSGMTVLDLGCGTGNAIEAMGGMGARIIGVDASSSMLAQARRKLKNRIAEGEVSLIKDDAVHYLKQVEDHSFDRVVLINVLYAVDDRKKLWKECVRVLKPGGKIVVTNSDRGGSKAIIREHLAHASKLALFNPKLIAVGIIDYFISELAKTQVFSFLDLAEIETEISQAGAVAANIERGYGGPSDGVNLLFDVKAI